ncbi:hypothetical protein RUND412_003829 [Rhizina undulata]
MGTSRICGSEYLYIPCSGAVDGGIIDVTANASGFYNINTADAYVNTTIPENITEFRNWWNVNDGVVLDPHSSIAIDKGAEHTVGEYSPIQQLVLDDGMINAELVVLGGIAKAQKESPTFDRYNAQNDPQLAQRAFQGGWVTNMLAAGYFNVTKKKMGVRKSYNLTDNDGNALKLKGIAISELNGDFFAQNGEMHSNFTAASMIRLKLRRTDEVNITNIAVECTTILGAAKRRDGNPNGLRFDPGSNWTIPIYTCASAIKASVKEVEFSVNGTYPELQNIQINSIEPVYYSSQASMPLWAMEKTGLPISQFSPLWGIVEDKYETCRTFLRSEETTSGAEFPASVLTAVTLLMSDADVLISDFVGRQTYSGENSFAMLAKWQNLSAPSENTSRIINLIWMDLMANSVMGSCSALTYESHASGNNMRMISVTPYARKITYNILYAIPALMILGLLFVLCSIGLFLWITSRLTMPLITQLINQTSTGRTVTNILYLELCPADAAKKTWVKSVGRKTMGFTVIADIEKNTEDSEAVALINDEKPPVTADIRDGEVENDARSALSVSTGASIRFGGVVEKKTPLSNFFKGL